MQIPEQDAGIARSPIFAAYHRSLVAKNGIPRFLNSSQFWLHVSSGMYLSRDTKKGLVIPVLSETGHLATIVIVCNHQGVFSNFVETILERL